MKNGFYVYAWCDPSIPGSFEFGEYQFSFLPFYIGKGKGYRASELNCRNGLCKNKLLSLISLGLKPIIVKIFETKMEEEAFKLEKDLIKLLGRLDIGTGILANHTDGGEGNANRTFSIDHRRRISESKKGFRWTKEQKARISGINSPNFNKKRSKEERKAISDGQTARIVSQETRDKIRKNVTKNWEQRRLKYGKNGGVLKHSDETKKLLAEMRMGDRNPMYGKRFTKEHRNKISKSLKNRIGPMKNKHHSEETKLKLSESLKVYWRNKKCLSL